MLLTRVDISHDAYRCMLSHALTTEHEEVMGLLAGESYDVRCGGVLAAADSKLARARSQVTPRTGQKASLCAPCGASHRRAAATVAATGCAFCAGAHIITQFSRESARSKRRLSSLQQFRKTQSSRALQLALRLASLVRVDAPRLRAPLMQRQRAAARAQRQCRLHVAYKSQRLPTFL